jgi:hypothetical protein
MNPILRRRYVLVILPTLAFLLFSWGLASAQTVTVDDVLMSNLTWRAAHPVTKARLRVLGGDGAPVGRYFLDLRPASLTEVSIMSRLLGKAELVVRTVKEASIGRIFFNEDAYVELDPTALSTLGSGGFWEAQTVQEMKDSFTEVFDIQGVVTKMVDEVTYTGVDMDLNQTKWDAFRASIGSDLVVNLPANTYTDVTVFFGPSGELHSVEGVASGVTVQILFYDWTDLTGSSLSEMDDARRPPHAAQELLDLPIDEATINYIARLTK